MGRGRRAYTGSTGIHRTHQGVLPLFMTPPSAASGIRTRIAGPENRRIAVYEMRTVIYHMRRPARKRFRGSRPTPPCPCQARPRAARDTRRNRHSSIARFVRRCSPARFQPGERLVIDDLAKRLGVSIIPVREALQMLQAEGLVVNVPHVGAAAAPLSRESIVDVFSVLEGLEVVATRFLAERGSPEAVRALEPIVRDMDAAAEDGRVRGLGRPEHALPSQAISAATGLPLLRGNDRTTARTLGSDPPLLFQWCAEPPRTCGAARASRHPVSARRARSSARAERSAAAQPPRAGGVPQISRRERGETAYDAGFPASGRILISRYQT